MASRRTRIKGIANIPQRRKLSNVTEDEKPEHVVNESNIEDNCRIENINGIQETSVKSNLKLDKNIEIVTEPATVINTIVKENKVSVGTDSTRNEPEKTPVLRRKFLKPTVSLNAFNRKSRVSIENEKKEGDTSPLPPKQVSCVENGALHPESNIPSFKTVINNYPSELPDNVKTPSINVFHGEPLETTLNETLLLPQSQPDENLGDKIKKVTPHIYTTHTSDTEYPPPPPSPSKINRSRIKAIPRLSQRKTSFSASESEDESRRNYNRHRNDSVCSAASGMQEPLSECLSPQRPREFNSVIQKKCRRSEQSRKLANARLDFMIKFGHKKPDRQKLTMIDLIFYNPTTNPMSCPKNKKESQEKSDDPDDPESVEIDSNVNLEDEAVQEQSDEENDMPVPQIKVGPQGEIILDEKSLVVESKQTKKGRKELQMSKVVNGDFDTGYGIYKRMKRAKDWSQNETLRFYKALNTIGTDFSLMCELFPRRSRRELKMKFKKEEKVNKTLIDKAVMQPCSFNLDELKLDMEAEEKELQQLEYQKEQESKIKKHKEERCARKRKASKLSEGDKTEEIQIPKKPPKIRKIRKPKSLDITRILDDDSDADESDVDSLDGSDNEELSMSLKPTRSGRVPKMIRKYDPDVIDSSTLNKKQELPATDENESDNVEPGSLMIIPTEGENGDSVYKVFMVAPNSNEVQNIFTISTSEPSEEPNETNRTIPAVETA